MYIYIHINTYIYVHIYSLIYLFGLMVWTCLEYVFCVSPLPFWMLTSPGWSEGAARGTDLSSATWLKHDGDMMVIYPILSGK